MAGWERLVITGICIVVLLYGWSTDGCRELVQQMEQTPHQAAQDIAQKTLLATARHNSDKAKIKDFTACNFIASSFAASKTMCTPTVTVATHASSHDQTWPKVIPRSALIHVIFAFSVMCTFTLARRCYRLSNTGIIHPSHSNATDAVSAIGRLLSVVADRVFHFTGWIVSNSARSFKMSVNEASNMIQLVKSHSITRVLGSAYDAMLAWEAAHDENCIVDHQAAPNDEALTSLYDTTTLTEQGDLGGQTDLTQSGKRAPSPDRRSGDAEKDKNYQLSAEKLAYAESCLNMAFIEAISAQLAGVSVELVLPDEGKSLEMPKVSRSHQRRLRGWKRQHEAVLREAFDGLVTIKKRLADKLKPMDVGLDRPLTAFICDVLSTVSLEPMPMLHKRHLVGDERTVLRAWLPGLVKIVNEHKAQRKPPWTPREPGSVKW